MKVDYSIIRGDSKDIDLDLVDAAGSPFNLTGASVVMRVGDLFTKDLTDGIDLSSGDLFVAIEPADTENAPEQRTAYPYDIAVTLADSTVHTAQRGLFIVIPDVPA